MKYQGRRTQELKLTMANDQLLNWSYLQNAGTSKTIHYPKRAIIMYILGAGEKKNRETNAS